MIRDEAIKCGYCLTQEFLMVETQTTCLKKSTEKCLFTPAELKAVGSDGNIISTQYEVVGVPGLFETGETLSGGIKAGRMCFIVPKGDPGVFLFHDPLLIGDTVFFSVAK